MFDSDRTSTSYGMGDRYYWAWGLIDFGNGTFQGAAHGMARLWQAGLWLYATPEKQFIARINTLFEGTKALTRKDGSLEEAFPNEGSYCVTALVAFDLLCTLDLLDCVIDNAQRSQWQAIVAPMIAYLKRADETHAIISNHLATAVAALLRWHRLTSDDLAENKAHELLNRIVKHQSEEGWFKEYEGADPGYQTLCTYYLADVHQQRPDLGLQEPLRRSIQYLWYFAHPDGSFGGLYGSRSTRFYYPAGIAALATEIPEAAALANYMAGSIKQHRVVTLSAIDAPNLIPMFNAYAWAAAISVQNNHDSANHSALTLPCQETQPQRISFPLSGIRIDRGTEHYTIINTHKGGVVYHYSYGQLPLIDAGVVIKNQKGQLGSTQAFAPTNKVTENGEQLEITAPIVAMPKQLPGPFQFLILRLFSLSLFRSATLREWIKQQLVKLLITRRNCWPIQIQRRIVLGKTVQIEDSYNLSAGYQRINQPGAFVPIHMASQGYWQVQDEEAKP